MSPRVLILDDDQDRHHAFDKKLPNASRTHVYTAEQAIMALDHSPAFDIVFLDHDLKADNPGTGTDVALHIARNLPRSKTPGLVWIHSWNPEGRRKMAQILRRDGIQTTVQRFKY